MFQKLSGLNSDTVKLQSEPVNKELSYCEENKEKLK